MKVDYKAEKKENKIQAVVDQSRYDSDSSSLDSNETASIESNLTLNGSVDIADQIERKVRKIKNHITYK